MRIDSLKPDNRNVKNLCCLSDVKMQFTCKRMSCINYEPDIVIIAEFNNLPPVQSAADQPPVMKGKLLLTAFGGIPEKGTGFLQFLSRQTALRRSAEYQYHPLAFRKRCVKFFE